MRHLLILSAMLAVLHPAAAQVTNFVLAATPRVYAGPLSVAVADVNGDGKPDLISASTGETFPYGALTILTNNGSNVFGLNAVLHWGGNGPRSVTVADVNGDGKPDLITANTFDRTLTVLTNNGSGVFGTNAILDVANPDYVTVADVNGDGKPDLISINGAVGAPETLMIFTNNGSGGFGSNATLNVNTPSGNEFPINVVAADVNEDGKPDLICPSPAAGAVQVWTNNVSGIFGSNATVSVGGTPDWVAIAEVNGDGKPDVICANAAGYLTVLTNNGSGGFGSNATLSVQYPAFVTVGDMNGDGKPDLICASPGAGFPVGGLPSPPGDDTLTIFTNDGSGGFALDGKLAVGGAPCSVAVADVNDDGQVDLICPSANSSSTNNRLDIFTNTIVPGHTGFRLVSSPVVGAYPASVTVADVNLDGKPDLISANAGTNTLTVLTNDGSGGFGSNATLNVGNIPACVVSADVNGDGKPDLISGSFYDGSLTVLTNDGNGGFVSNATVNAGPGFPSPYVGVYSIATADVNGDGRPDLIRANYYAFSLTVFTNNGGGVLGSNATLMTWNSPRDMAVADVNGDGRPDLVCVSAGSVGGLPPPDVYNMVFTNDGTGSFGTNAAQIFGSPSVSVAVADINDDGKPDLVTVDANDDLLRVWTNNGSGVFGSNVTLSVEGIPTSIALADVNRDGKPDVICASYDSSVSGYPGYLTAFTNNGTGIFGLYTTLAVGSYPHCVVAADVNGDGRLDLITANFFDNNLSLLFNVPYLDMSAQANAETLVWPYPSSGYALQQNTDLGTTNWVHATNTVNFIGGRNQVTLLRPAGNDFFRLMHP